MIKRCFCVLLLIFCLLFNNFIIVLAQETKYPDYSYEFLGEDKLENFNRKIFNFNSILNKYAIRPVHVLWASIMPEYGMDRIKGVTNNIEYPIRLMSSLIQRDFKTSKDETVRFFTNTILGLGGMFDPASHLFKLEQSSEDMEQALASCKMKSGQYFVLPILSFTSFRGALGKVLDMALNPSCYIGTPVIAMIKAGLTVNKTSFLQPLIKMIESTYADPYEIAKKVFGINSYIKCANLDRVDVTSNLKVAVKEDENVNIQEKTAKVDVKTIIPPKKEAKDIVKTEVSSQIANKSLLYGGTNIDKLVEKDYSAESFKLKPDIILKGFNPQNPVVDSMRTALFSLPGVDESIWNELSIWNRSFSHRIKTGSVNIVENRDNYSFRYILQKDKQHSPLAIIYPSIGEGINSTHSVLLAKLFYDAGYSVLIQGSHFQWEFVKSMPVNYRPGLPANDAEALRTVTAKIIQQLQDKYNAEFEQKVFIGTSFGALTSLFVGAKEYKNNTLGNSKYIAICPPIDLIYAMKQVDKNSEEWNKSSDDFKRQVALTASKVVKLYQKKDNIDFEINNLPFSEEEGKLITGFLMHQKLSDLIFTIENTPKNKNTNIYHVINNMNYQDYAQKYLLTEEQSSCEDLVFVASLHSIANYLENSDNYVIYHSLNDYLINKTQLKYLKEYSKDKLVLLDNGAHLGFLYRNEFIENLKNTIAFKN